RMVLDVGIHAGAVGEPQTYPFTVIAKVTGGEEGALPIEAHADFVHVPPVELGMRVELETIHDKQGDYKVILTKPTSRTLDVTLEANDPEEALSFYFHEETDHLQIPRETTVTTEGIVRMRQGAPEEARVFPFTIGARARNVDGPGELATSVDGELVFEPAAPV